MQIKLYQRIVVTDTATGKVIRRTRLLRCHSFVVGFLKLLQLAIQHDYGVVTTFTLSITDTGGVARTFQNNGSGAQSFLALNPPDSGWTFGLMVGTGTTAPTNADTALQTVIAHGTGAGQLHYGASTWTTAGVVGSNVDLVFSRAFYNGSGGSITVNEIGGYFGQVDSTGNARNILGFRDVVTPVAVADKQTLTVQYTLRTTV